MQAMRSAAGRDMTVVCAPNAFKGTLSAHAAALAMARGVRDAGAVAIEIPVADGATARSTCSWGHAEPIPGSRAIA